MPANGLDIAYEAFGDPAAPPVLLVMGLGTQMIAWPDQMCEAIADAGHYVVRFDNRDVGLSTHLRGVRAPSLAALATRRAQPPYTLTDMADDAFALLDALDLGSAHVVGASMGGFIAQTMALARPDRVRSLGLIMTSTGGRRVGLPKPGLIRQLLRRRDPAASRDDLVAGSLTVLRRLAGPGYPFDADYVRELTERSLDRAYDPGGYLRQLSAVAAQPDRTARLRQVRVPAVVMHGLDDPLVGYSGGIAVARALPRAEFVGLPGMGHDLPRPLWPRFAQSIVDVAARA